MSIHRNGINIVKCVVVGNSPRITGLGDIIDEHDYVIRTGIPITDDCRSDIGAKVDMLVTRHKKYMRTDRDYVSQFKHKITIEEKPIHVLQPDSIIILHNMDGIDLNDNVLGVVDQQIGLKPDEKATLGCVALFVAMCLSDVVSVCGIEVDYNSNYIDIGHYGDVTYKRVNDRHCIYKEMLYINKLIRTGKLISL